MQNNIMNIFLSPSSVSSVDRHLLNGHSGGLLWFTGLSGRGKSTLAHSVEDKLNLNVAMTERRLRRGSNKKAEKGEYSNRIFERNYLIFQRFCLDNGVHFTAEYRTYCRKSNSVTKWYCGWLQRIKNTGKHFNNVIF